MKCLTQQEIARWLTEQCVTPSPYGSAKSPTHYLQFKFPKGPVANTSFIRQFLKLTSGDILVHVTDWPTYKRAEMAVVNALRHEWGESRNLIDAPGHLFPANESGLATALFGHTGNFAWNAYLYLPGDLATLYNWEGELYDFWSNDAATQLALERLTGEFGLATEIAG